MEDSNNGYKIITDASGKEIVVRGNNTKAIGVKNSFLQKLKALSIQDNEIVEEVEPEVQDEPEVVVVEEVEPEVQDESEEESEEEDQE